MHGYDEVSGEMFDAGHSMSSELFGNTASVSEFSVGGGLSMVDSMPDDNISPPDTVFDASFDALSVAPTELSADPAWGVSDLLPEPDWR